MMSVRKLVLSKTLHGRLGQQAAHFSLAKAVPSKVSTRSIITNNKQAIMNVAFSFFTCILGAQVLRIRYETESVEEERDELLSENLQLYKALHNTRLNKLCESMEASEQQCSILSNHFLTTRSIIKRDYSEIDKELEEEIIPERLSVPGTVKPKVKKGFI